MPYACSSAGGRVMLRPSYEETYRIYGGRQQRLFNACSPVNPSLCRTWMLHAFDIDCAGVRVSWPAVVAAGAELNNRRAWLMDNGRLQVAMGPWWGTPAGRPCGPGRWGGRYDRDCVDRESYRAPAVVEMPAGFAPMLGIGARFVNVEGPPPVAAAGPPGPAPLPNVITPTPKVARAEPPREALPKEPPAKEAAAKAPPPPKDVATHEAPKEVVVKPLSAPAEPSPANAAKAGGTPAAPRIINAPAASLPVEAKAAPDKAPSSTLAKNVPPPVAAPAPVRETAALPPPAAGKEIVSGPHSIAERPTPAAARETQSAPSSVMSARAPSNVQAIGLAVALVLAVLSLFAWTRWRERTRLAGVQVRDFAARDLGARAPPAASPRPALAPPAAPVRGAAPSAPPPPQASAAPPPPFPAAGDGFPRNRAEAIAMLGANTDAGIEALKKIVDGLRQSWHPDHATSEADRTLREHRIKQINTAWDLIVGRRAPAA